MKISKKALDGAHPHQYFILKYLLKGNGLIVAAVAMAQSLKGQIWRLLLLVLLAAVFFIPSS